MLAWVQGDNWDTAQLASFEILNVGVKGYRMTLDAGGLTLELGEDNRRLALPPLTPAMEHLVAIRWQNQSVELWLDRRLAGRTEGITFAGFPGRFECADPQARKQPYRIHDVSAFRMALADVELNVAFHNAGFCNTPALVIPPTTRPPAIDGNVTDEEWSAAAQITGLHRMEDRYLAQVPSHVWVMYDDQRLYAAYQGAFPPCPADALEEPLPERLLRTHRQVRDHLPDTDDAFEITVVPDYPAGTWHRISVNHLGVSHDCRMDVPARPRLSWNPEIEAGTSLSSDGWFVEMSVPLDAFGSPHPKPGTTWGMNFRRIWRQLLRQSDEWATGTRLRGTNVSFWSGKWGSSSTVGQVHFGRPDDLIPRLRHVEPSSTGTPSFLLELRNPGDTAREAATRITLSSGEPDQTRSVHVPAHDTVTVPFDSQPSGNRSAPVTLLVEDLPTRLPLCRASFAPSPESGPRCIARYYPSQERIDLSWDLSPLRPIPATDLAIEVHFVNRQTSKLELSQGVSGIKDYIPEAKVPTTRLPEGQYVLATIIGHNRKEVGRTLQLIEKRPKPDWLGNALGLAEDVPPPFLPVKLDGLGPVAGRKISVLGRTYDFGRSALPDQILIGDEPILASPIRLMVERPHQHPRDLARDVVWGRGAGNPILPKSHAIRIGRVEWTSTSAASDSAVKPGISGWAEYDGLLWFTIQIGGERWESVSLLQIQIPIRKEWAVLMNDFEFSRGTTGRPRPEGTAKAWGPVWIGNERGGIQWLTESQLSWRLSDPRNAIRVIPRDNETILQVTLIDHEVNIAGTFKAEFGLVATPVRPRESLPHPATQSLRTARPWSAFDWPDDGDSANPVTVLAPAAAAQPGHPDPAQTIDLSLSLCRATASPAGLRILPAMDIFFHEWAADTSQRWTPGAKSLVCAPSSRPWQDLILWCHARAIESRSPPWISLRSATPVFSDNRYAGGGAVREGTFYPKWSLLGSRDFLKRIYAATRRARPDSRILLHTSGQLLAPLLAFCDAASTGDELRPILSTEHPSHYEHLSLDACRALGLTGALGPVIVWSPQNRQALGLPPGRITIPPSGPVDPVLEPDRESRWIATMALLHRAHLLVSELPGDASDFIKLADDCRIESTQTAFFGYWDRPAIQIEPAREGLVASIYLRTPEKPDASPQILVAVINNTDWQGDVRMTLDWERLHCLPDGMTVVERANADSARLEGTQASLRVVPRDGHLVVLGTKP